MSETERGKVGISAEFTAVEERHKNRITEKEITSSCPRHALLNVISRVWQPHITSNDYGKSNHNASGNGGQNLRRDSLVAGRRVGTQFERLSVLTLNLWTMGYQCYPRQKQVVTSARGDCITSFLRT